MFTSVEEGDKHIICLGIFRMRSNVQRWYFYKKRKEKKEKQKI